MRDERHERARWTHDPPARWPMAYDAKLDRDSLPKFQMPNSDGFAPDSESSQQNCSGRSEMRIAKALIVALVALTLLGKHAMSADGLITTRSSFGPEETMKRFEAEVRAKGMTVLAHVDHAAGAAAAGMPLRPTDLLIFGGAKGGNTADAIGTKRSASTCRSRRAGLRKARPAQRFFPTTIPAISRAGTNSGDSAKPVVEAMSGALKELAAKATTVR